MAMKKHEHSERPKSVKGSLENPPVPKVKRPVSPPADKAGKSGKSPIQIQGFGKARFR